jgi:hypothetical protein
VNAMREVRALCVVLLLLGSLLPQPGLSLVTIGSIGAGALIGWEALHWTAHVARCLAFVLPLFGLLAASGIMHPSQYAYGQHKLSGFLTLTLLSALAPGVIRDQAHLVTLARTWLVVSTGLAISTLIGAQVAGRSEGLVEANPIWIARALATAIVVLVWLRWQKLLPFVAFVPLGVLLLSGLFATGSRGPLSAALVGLGGISMFAHRRRGPRVLVLLLSLAALVITAWSNALGSSRIASYITNPGGGLTGSARARLWAQTVDVVSSHPRGVGFGNWGYYTYNTPYFFWPHDLVLEVFAESGWIVGAGFLGVVIWTVGRLLRCSRADPTISLVFGLLLCELVSVSVSGDLNARTFFALLTIGWVPPGWVQRRHSLQSLASTGPTDRLEYSTNS